MDGKAKALDAAWAAEAMKERISWLGKRLAAEGAVAEEWREDAECAMRLAVLRAAGRYDPDAARAAGKAAASPLHWLHVAADREARHIMLRGWYRKRRARFTPLELDADGCVKAEGARGGGAGTRGENARAASDGCRSMKALFFRLDRATLRAMLARGERRLLDLRLGGATFDEAAAALGVTRATLRRRFLAPLAAKAAACGFSPARGKNAAGFRARGNR